ncbi:hypothetical protein GKZ90_0002325 [Flavobacterium sp. MC2016-06]|uniref:hypothetical protein n=1 Tax=Flavobacterium sp. MC2016-06 TaxID=2676308 RepID=UPI0012BB03C9|nr:hypothetical protein [Flavobacterium sp. MC2016-06]MBU3858286.1 hypothetical protein [Flavobacterium sp. MC2016-06]
MKTLKVILFALFLVSAQSYSQIKVQQITYKIHDHYIATTIGYDVIGTYYSEGKKDPTIVLNSDGTGVFQYEDLSKKNINWGIECSEEGVPEFKEGFNSATYTFWYQLKGTEDWMYTQFSIHFNKKKMYIMGERVKEYEEDYVSQSASNK